MTAPSAPPVAAPGVPTIAGASLHWLLTSASSVPADGGWLAPRERHIESGLRVPKRRSDWRLGRWAAKRAVGCFCAPAGLAPSRIEILPRDSGAPYVLLNGHPCSCSISISHSAGRALVTLSAGGFRQGCDLEVIEPRPASFERDYFTLGELELLSCLRGRERALTATLVWCLKEGALKALGEGLRMDTREVAVTYVEEPGDSAGWSRASLRSRAAARTFAGWWRVEGEQVAAVVVLGAPERALPGRPLRLAG